MRKVYVLFLLLMTAVFAMAQSSQKMSYQAVVRDANNRLVANNNNITVEISILDSNAVVAYAERHNNVHSNANGLISVMIGEGTVISGSMNGVAWHKAQIKTKVTVEGNSPVEATVAVTAVPYALYADNLNAGGQTLIHIYEALADTAGDIRADIPAAANDATITLQKNGTAVGNFTVNTATDKSINITVPENVSDLGDAANYVTVNRLGDTLSHYYTTTVINDTLNHYYTINNLNDTLGHYYTAGEINDTLGHYYTSSQIHDTLKVINNMLTVIENRVVEFNQHVCDSVQACVSALVSDSIHGAITRESIVVDEHYVHTDRNYTTADSLKLAGIEAGAQRNVQSDWNVSDATSDAYIQNKPTIPAAANDATITLQKNGTAVGNFTVNTATDKSINITVPENVSDLGDAANYVTVNRLGDTLSHYYTTTVINDTLNHYYTINNLNDTLGHYYTGGEINDTLGHYYTSSQIHDTLKVINDMLTVIETRVVEFNQHVCDSVQACVSALVSDSIHGAITRESIVVDEHYVHTDRNYTTADSLKLAGIEAGAQRNVQSDWNVSDATSDAYIQNKPTIPAAANDATITLQKNGTAVDNFTVNASADKSINITVPENVSDLGDAANYVTVTKLEDTLSHFVSNDACPTVNICDLATLANQLVLNLDSLKGVVKKQQDEIDSLAQELQALKDATMPAMTLTSNPSSAQKICIGSGTKEVTYTADISNDDVSRYTFTWTVDGSVQAESGNTFTQSYSGAGTKKVVCQAVRTGVELTDSLISTISTETAPSMVLCTECEEGKVYIKAATDVSSAVWYNDSDVEVGTWKGEKTGALPTGTYHVVLSSASGCVATIEDIKMEVVTTYCTVSSVKSNETGSGSQISAVQDHEGNSYKVVQIGSQCWLKENMRATTSPTTGTYFVNKEPVSSTNLNSYSGKQARWYKNDSLTYAPKGYGLSYNWNAAVDTFNTIYGELSVDTNYEHGVNVTFSGHRRGICPAGWHVPSSSEWNEMISSADAMNKSGKLVSGCAWGTASEEPYHPCNYNDPERNSSGFSARPNGYLTSEKPPRFYAGHFAFWYDEMVYDSKYAKCIRMYLLSSDTNIDITWFRSQGASVRCVRDE